MAKTISKKETPKKTAPEQTAPERSDIQEAVETLAAKNDGKAKKTFQFGIALTEDLGKNLKRLCRIKGVHVNAYLNELVQKAVDENADLIEKYRELL